ncbi:GTP cyclohydrolase II [Companilactobacillus keshanensis]|uniref:GTP cyclohydrolase-2 n=1 Tax=Companilactobacillus keshanensis TaxID=2486003 RepID=A0ABW4BTC1_9LACO|nr:GTP cyclohydrolase II [Companilactobacillus keshanensis]
MIDNKNIEQVKQAITDLKNGKLIIVADSPNRESEGDMIGLADFVSPENVNHMINKARGLLCVPMSKEYADRLGLQRMTTNSTDAFGTAFTVSTDAKTTTTGISAFDRAKTIQKLTDSKSSHDDFYHPGHIFPLIARDNGVLDRDGHTEAAVDLAKLAGANPIAYICEIIKKDGTMARLKDLKAFAEGSQMTLITIKDISDYRYMFDKTISKSITKVDLPTKYGDFKLEAFNTSDNNVPTLLITKGEISLDKPLLLRVHSECFTGDVLGSRRCDCGEQLEESLRMIEENGSGAVIYLRQEGRGIGLLNKLKAYKLQEQGFDTVEANKKLGFEADMRNYGIAANILHQKGIEIVDLMTNNPKKISGLENLGIEVNQRISLEITPTENDFKYLKTKKDKLHHILSEVN